MTKRCIVCGGAAGSKEHVFSAALGGRRKNSGIYCTEHDNSYSGLVGEIATQLDFLNAYLGVYPDHSDQKKAITAMDSLTGAEINISADGVKLTKPRVVSRAPAGNGEALAMAFPNRQSMNQWIKGMESDGYRVSKQTKPTEEPFIFGPIHHVRGFGGPCGLGWAAYVMQTFLVQELPQVARSGAISDFITYTQAIARIAALHGCEEADSESVELIAARLALETALNPFQGVPPVWWDFDLPQNATKNSFEFGHRVTVGVDGSDGQIYGRVSLFSTLNFAAQLGVAPLGSEGMEIIIDIDPLARHPPNDIKRFKNSAASSRVKSPEPFNKELAQAIASGEQKRAFEDLMRRLTDYQLSQIARTMIAALASCSAMGSSDAKVLIDEVVNKQSQQIWRLTSFVVEGFRDELIKANLGALAPALDSLIARDVNSVNGLSLQAQASLALAKAAIAHQMSLDCVAGLINEERVADLMGRGPGQFIVGKAVLAPFQQAIEGFA